MSTGQIFWHFPHRVQVSGYQASWRKLEPLKNEKIAPRGQETLQKMRLIGTDAATKKSRMDSFTQKREPIIACSPRFSVIQGSPAMSVPTGHSLENQFWWVM